MTVPGGFWVCKGCSCRRCAAHRPQRTGGSPRRGSRSPPPPCRPAAARGRARRPAGRAVELLGGGSPSLDRVVRADHVWLCTCDAKQETVLPLQGRQRSNFGSIWYYLGRRALPAFLTDRGFLQKIVSRFPEKLVPKYFDFNTHTMHKLMCINYFLGVKHCQR